MPKAVVIVLLALAGLGAAAEPSVTLRVDRQTVAVDTPFLIVVEGKGGNMEAPEFPDMDGLHVDQAPSQSSTRTEISFVGGQMQRDEIRELGYRAWATREGTVRIPAVEVRMDGKAYRTQPVQLTVKDSSLAQPTPRGSRPGTSGARGFRGSTSSTREPEPAEQKETDLTWEMVAFIESNVDKREVYQGEPIMLRLELWQLRLDGVESGTRSGVDLRYPDTEGFYATTLEPERTHRQRDGRPYDVTAYRQLLCPTVSGELEIGAWAWCGVGRALTRMGWQRRNFDLETVPITVTVKPLPPSPAGFSGAVGSFDFDAQVSRDETVQGTPIRLTLTVKGQGNPNVIGEPQLPAIEGTYVSTPEKETRPLDDTGASGAAVKTIEKKIEYLVTPLEQGEMVIPEITFCYFDPESEEYETIARGPFTVNVLVSPDSGHRVLVGSPGLITGSSVDVIGEDLRPIVTDVGRLNPQGSSTGADAALAIMPVAGYIGLAAWMRRKRRFERDTGLARDHRAKAKGRKRIKAAVSATNASEELYRALIGYVADKCNASEGGLTSHDTRALLAARGVENDIIDPLIRILRACERSQYGGTGLSKDEVSALVHAASPALDAVDKALARAQKTRGKAEGASS